MRRALVPLLLLVGAVACDAGVEESAQTAMAEGGSAGTSAGAGSSGAAGTAGSGAPATGGSGGAGSSGLPDPMTSGGASGTAGTASGGASGDTVGAGSSGLAGAGASGAGVGGVGAGGSGAGGVAAGAAGTSGAPAGGNGGGTAGASGGGQAGASAGAAGSGRGGSGGSVNQGALPNVTLHLAGDSTVMTYEAGSAQEGWGQEVGQLFISKVSIDNQSIGGASVRMFQSGSRWTNIVSRLKAGDYVMIQFGTNDSGSVAGRHVDPPDFTLALTEMSAEVSAKQATTIFVTPSALQEWSGGKEGNSRLGPYADAMRTLGPMKGILVDDLNARSVEYLNMIGQTAAMQVYIDGDKAHFTKQGATQMATFVAAELERIGSPLAAYLKQ